MTHQVTELLASIERGEPQAAEQLLPLVYKELRRLAAHRLSRETPGQTLDATALVHEAYLRLVNVSDSRPTQWEGRGHFFAAAAEAMRRILVEQARRKQRTKHGGGFLRIELNDTVEPSDNLWARIIEVDQALTKLSFEDPIAAEVVKLHYFTGLSLEEVGKCLKISRATAYRNWTYARTWLKTEIER